MDAGLGMRQACCHPQVGASGLRALSSRTPLSMDAILEVLVTKATTEAEEELRAVLSSLNGLAALQQLQGRPAEAVASYREACGAWDQALREGVPPADPSHGCPTLCPR